MSRLAALYRVWEAHAQHTAMMQTPAQLCTSSGGPFVASTDEATRAASLRASVSPESSSSSAPAGRPVTRPLPASTAASSTCLTCEPPADGDAAILCLQREPVTFSCLVLDSDLAVGWLWCGYSSGSGFDYLVRTGGGCLSAARTKLTWLAGCVV